MKRIVASILVMTTVFAVAGCGNKGQKEATSATNVTVYTVGEQDIESSLDYVGEIKEGELVSVTSKVSAKVMQIPVKEGQYVTAGTVLAQLDTTDLQLAYNQALAAYNSAAANLDMTRNATVPQSETAARQKVSAAQIEYDSASAAYERERMLYDSNATLTAATNAAQDAQVQMDRVQKLFDLGAVSQVELDAAKTALQNAQAALSTTSSNVQTALDAAKSRLDNATENLRAAKENLDLTVRVVNVKNVATVSASVDSAKAALDIASDHLQNASLIAPISGYVSLCTIHAGQMVTPGVELFSIKNTNTVEVELQVAESVIGQIRIGSPARITVPSARQQDLPGVITQLNPTKNPQTGLYMARVTIPNEEGELKVGMFADVELVTARSEDVLVIPSEAILQDGESSFVYLAKEGQAKRRTVTVGVSGETETEILSGLRQGDQVVVKGKDYLSEKNTAIRIVTE